MLDKYIKINDKMIVSGQDGKTGMWYCKELPAETTKQTETMIGELNKIYNEYNKDIKAKKDKDKDKKDKTLGPGTLNPES